MDNLPKIFSHCKAGCLWETVHRSEFKNAATHIEIAVLSTGSNTECPIEQGREYKIFSSREDFYIGVLVNNVIELQIVNENNDPYSDFINFRFLGIETVESQVVMIYEFNGVRYEDTRDIPANNNTPVFTEITSVSYTVRNADRVLIYNADASIVAGEDGEDGVDGKSVFIRYSSSPDGKPYSDAWYDGCRYIGIATGTAAPREASGYQWIEFIADTSSFATKKELQEAFAGAPVWSDTYDPNKAIVGFEIAYLDYENSGETRTICQGTKVYNLYGDYNTWQPFTSTDGFKGECSVTAEYIYEHGTFEAGFITIDDNWINSNLTGEVGISRWLQ